MTMGKPSDGSLNSFSFDGVYSNASAEAFRKDYADTTSRKRPYPFTDKQTGAYQNVVQAQHDWNSKALPCLLGAATAVNAQLQGHASSPPLLLFETESMELRIELVGNYLELVKDGRTFARLNTAFCSEARRLIDLGADFRAYLERQTWDNFRSAAAATVESAASTFAVEINVYSHRQQANHIGDILAQAGIFLQRPIYGMDESEYFNPQILHLNGFIGSANRAISIREADHATPTTSILSKDVLDTAHANDVSEVFDIILDSLDHSDILDDQVTTKISIKNGLLQHQKTALNFVFQRESDQIPGQLSLWKLRDRSGEPCYQHVLSKATRSEPQELRGGIIADEMGLGKTLVMIAAIAETITTASNFAAVQRKDGTNTSNGRHRTRATLVMTPSVLLIDSWINELNTHTYAGSITYHRHLGSDRSSDIEKARLLDRDIVFTTFATAASELRSGSTVLSDVHWYRVILDEAHKIRNRNTKQFEAVHQLTSLNRWCLSGTPMQNHLEDLGALVAFLKDPILESTRDFRKYIVGPASKNDPFRFQNLRTMLESICIRRTREVIGLPKIDPHVEYLSFSDQELKEYEELYDSYKTRVHMATSGRGPKQRFVLQCVHQLRIFCNNGKKLASESRNVRSDEHLSYLQQLKMNNCTRCSEPIHSIDELGDGEGGSFIEPCKHLVCYSCFPLCINEERACSLCSKGHKPQVFLNHGVAETMDSTNSSRVEYPSKLRRLLCDIQQDPACKCIVFSSWKKTLDLAAELLKNHDIRHDTIHGGLTFTRRLKVLNDFKSQPELNVLLMTLGTGAEGLNLKVANRIYLLEPQWNPFLERQAMARAQRIGQTHEVRIIRYIMKGSIEASNVMNRQLVKEALAGGGFVKVQTQAQRALLYFGVEPN